jgi:signal transduction histidine kinase
MLVETVALVTLVAAGTLVDGVRGTIIAGAIAAVGVLFLSLRLTNQFSELTEGILRTMSIERSHRLDPTGPAELARMARAVNRLVDSVETEIAEEEEERTRLASILDSMREGVVVVDDQGVIESTNPAASELLDTAGVVEPGMQLTSLTNHPDVTRVVVETIDTERRTTAEIELFDNQRTLMAMATPFPRPGSQSESQPVRALLLLTDLSDIRRLDITRREFVSNASHELRTPLAGIRASAETLERGAIEDPQERDKFLSMIRQDVDRMDALIGEMLELSRLETGEAPLELENVDPKTLAESAVKNFFTMAQESSLELRSVVPDDLPLVFVDSRMIDSVFSNLIGNAIRWTPPGGKITVNGWEDDDMVWFSVADTGQGIEAEYLPHVFERFFKIDPARSQPGTGLGLSIARHIVEAHQGAISATSALGDGSEFTFTVPTAGQAAT